MLEVHPRSALRGLLHRASDERKIFRMGVLEHRFQARPARFVQAEEAKRLPRPNDLFARRAQPEAAGVAQALGLGQVRFASSQRLLRLLSILDVGAGSEPAYDLSGAVVQWHPSAQEPTVRTIGAPQPRLDLRRLAVGERSLYLGSQPVPIIVMNRRRPTPAKLPVPRHAPARVKRATRIVQPTLAEVIDQAVGRCGPDQRGNVVEDASNLPLGLPCLLLGRL